MDFIFPRLGRAKDRLVGDAMSLDDYFAIRSLDEARAFLVCPILGNRYRECVEALSMTAEASAEMVFGEDDARKLQASLTLFAEASNEQLLRIMLTVWFDDRVDEETIVRLGELSDA
jgi:uncharacterized protein (DUF1810 family)